MYLISILHYGLASTDCTNAVRPPGDSDRSRARTPPRVGISEHDLATVSSYRQRYRLSHNGHARNELGDSDFLRRIGAAAEAEDGRPHPTVAGLLMFGHDWASQRSCPTTSWTTSSGWCPAFSSPARRRDEFEGCQMMSAAFPTRVRRSCIPGKRENAEALTSDPLIHIDQICMM